jgi:precorrin-3B synthase
MSAPVKKGWCPTALLPMPSGDGLLVRIASPESGLSTEMLQKLAALSADFGNGQIEITPRLNWQLRGLRSDRHADFIREARAAGLVTVRDEALVPVIVSPFCDHESQSFGDRLRQSIEALPHETRFPGKFCVVLSAGTFPLSDVHADIRIDGIEGGWRLSLAGTSDTALMVGAGNAVEIGAMTSALLDAAARMALDERPAGSILLARWLTLAGIDPASSMAAPRPNTGAPPTFTMLEPPFGRVSAADIAELADNMDRKSKAAIVPGRRFALTRDARALGWAERKRWNAATDARRRISVCTGAPACAQGFAATLPLAERIAIHYPAQGPHVHISGCSKGCALRERAGLAITATQGGFYMLENATASEALGGSLLASEADVVDALFRRVGIAA